MQTAVRSPKQKTDLVLVSQDQERGPLDEPGFTFTPTGLKIEPNVKFPEWENYGRKLQLADRGVQWAIGDWLLHGENHWPDKYDQAVEVTGFREQTLLNYVTVARAIPDYRRRELVDFSTHAEVASLPENEADRILAQAAGDPRVTRDVVRKEAQRIKRRLKQNPSELELIHDPEVREFVGIYIDSLKDWEKTIPPKAPFLRNMLHAHIGQAQWQLDRTLSTDCDAILEMFEGVAGGEGVYRATDDDIFQWLQKVGYFMRDPELDERLQYMLEHKMLQLVSCEGSRQEGRRGTMLDLYELHPDYLAKQD